MIIGCPACSTRYLVDEQQLGATGRMVRCGQCGHSWYEAPSADEKPRVVLSGPEAPPPLPGERRGLPAVSRRRRRGGWAKSLAMLLLLGLAGAEVTIGILARQQIKEQIPVTLHVFSQLGSLLSSPRQLFLDHAALQPQQEEQPSQTQSQDQNQNPAGGGLQIQQLTPRRAVENGIPILVISGQIVNSSAVEQPVPKMRATLRDPNDNTIASWTFSSDVASLPPGGSVSFETSMAQPSDLAAGVFVTFESP